MAEEFTIKSASIENKINQLLPSQGGFQPGVDFSASTMVIPIVDLTETAEGSSLRLDLQKALSFSTATAYSVSNSTSTVITTTGYWRIVGTSYVVTSTVTPRGNEIIINDGTTDKNVWSHLAPAGDERASFTDVDIIVLLKAGESLKISSAVSARISGSVRQVASLAGDLVDP